MSVYDHGGSYRLGYLGSLMLTHASTGLGMLQKPLRELYFKHCQTKNSPLERHLALTAKGMVISHQSNPASVPEESFYPMNNIVFWDAVQFVTVKGRDKKHKGAFEPLDIDHSRNKDNLFSVIEKKYQFLIKQTHPPMFTCALRRTEGVKSIDVHVFLCLSIDEALSIVHGLNDLQYYINSDAERSAAFDYNHYPKPRSIGSKSHENSPDSTFAAGQHFGGPRGYAQSDRGSQFGDSGSRFNDRGSHFGDQEPVSPVSPNRPRFGVPAIGPQAGVVAALGAPRAPTKPYHQQHQMPPAPSHPPPTRPQTYNLTQDDFQSPQKQFGYQDQTENEHQQNIPHRQQSDRDYNRYEVSGNNTYEYIRHIDQEIPSRPNRLPRADAPPGGSVYTTTLATRPQPAIHPDYREDYNSMSRDMYVADSTLQPGTGADYRNFPDDNYMHTIRGEKSPDRFDDFSHRPQLPERSAPHYAGERNPAPRSHMFNSDMPERELLREYKNQQRQSGGFGHNQRPVSIDYTENPRPLSQISEQSSKPIAMVQPRKVQGVKVLPNMPLSPRNNEASYGDDGVNTSSQLSIETNNVKSNVGPSSPGMNYKEYYDNREIKKEKEKKNWQFGANEESSPVGTLKPPDDGDQFKTTDEQRHLRMKKEAELATVFQEMQVDDKTFKMSDFERGLGYLP